MLALLTVIVAACGSATATGAPPATGAPQASDPVAEAGLPAPDFAWAFEGDGKASAGGMDVEFLGAHESSAHAVAFDGYTGHGMAAQGLVDTTRSFTLSAWANYAKLSPQSAVLAVLGDDSYAAALAVGGDSEWSFATKTTDTTGIEHAVQVQTAPVRAGNRWTHVVGVYDGDTGVIRLYIDGERVGEAAAGAPFSAKGPLTIGRGQYDGGPGNFWPGAIDSVAVYQSVLTDPQIASIHDSTRPTSLPPPMPAPDPSTYANGLLNGTWDFVLDEEGAEVLLQDYAAFVDSADKVTVRLGFDGHEWWEGVLFDGELILHNGEPEGSNGTFIIDGDKLVTTESEGDGVSTWTLTDDRLTLELVEFCSVEGPQQTCDIADPLAPEWKLPITIFNHTFTKSGDDPGY